MPYKDPDYHKKYYQKNKEKMNISSKKWAAANLESIKESKLKYYIKNKDRNYYRKKRCMFLNISIDEYLERKRLSKIQSIENEKKRRRRSERKRRLKKLGTTYVEFNQTLEKQKNKCACCFEEFDLFRKACADHCHETGKFRSILCQWCNLAEGTIKKVPGGIKSISRYIKNYCQTEPPEAA